MKVWKIIYQIVFYLAAGLPLWAQEQPINGKPNIIYIYADDLGYAELGAYGQQQIKTPHLDRMASEGMRFTQHYSGAPVCAPSRCMLMTGKHAGHAYIRGNYPLGGGTDESERGQMPLPEGTYTLPKMLQEAGYVTGMSGKWGLGMHNTTGSPLRQGFDYYFGYLDQRQAHSHYPTHLWENDREVPLNNTFIEVHRPLDPKTATKADFESFKGETFAPALMTARALDFIDAHQKRPFFLYLPYTLPHASLQAPDVYIDRYKDKFADTPYYGQGGYASTLYPRATYAAMISFLDDQVGLIMDKIKELGLDENTIIMFSSDNGTAFNGGVDYNFFQSVGGLHGFKMDVYEGGIREPFLVRWPGKVAPNSTSDLISAQYDVMATVAEVVDARLANTDGVSLLPTLLGNDSKQQTRSFLYWEYPEKGGQLAIRIGDWKGVKVDLKENPGNPWMLFNLQTDRGETKDVAREHPDLLKKLDEIVAREHQMSHLREWNFVDSKKP
ncbi:arylsulfatase [Sphingobacterium griseoflavum]|uniref:N-acetylgalactosamine-6-sulfatase n=1 Tax=Sphingobacterium griseoflavum TaxID=1474952 RepID=A0ABQ3HYG0_9SPHI|nr:arylsulfatase [Sphingobacterium griseoflavum]GHE32817.1 N-acetylgalactosamine-6-sulfatase [Sphingobacterium griseoflavum]